ncbi:MULTISPECIES: heat shock protein Hsp18 [Sporomusa]|uniref:18 kDa heat shock protein n=1 Tax=Sporomusa sphaeroides DSM 2875 TaxID=1337886 RepID=A0ABP2CCV3_9FIRM|nr:heat shock protein Hsp18 [Sporomusa sphaeroides]MCM0758573.1 Hsp20/alpha crystallin family protein [Sporomusa sphaeroides DSM 2875]OLS56064.1 18 kDa heat shock protein [Sporomusa sphaeroides DSM 2875]CVK20275.1 18 kDa heat shock protein [Sporomusa sphaeroides DSM 2875]HML33497.1 Hsp20/alpha crystallin family protein [Sporomusa sphaeroides]
MFGLVPFRNRNLPARDHFNQLMHGFFDDDFITPFGNMGNPFRIDLRETESAYIVEADLPGIKKGDITLQYENQYLTISAKRDETSEVKDNSYVRRERRYGQFQRSIYIDNVMDDKIDAKFDDGVLTVTLPKQDKTKKRPGNIPIR